MDKKQKCICLVALLLAFLAIGMAASITSTTIGVKYIRNNTNLAPTIVGDIPGTGERVQNITYYANNSPIELFVFAHAATVSSPLAVNLSIDGVVVEPDQRKPIATADNSYVPIHAIIPQYSNYSVNITNFHHYEWREYQILTGNVTTTNGTGSGGAGTPCTNCINATQLSDNMSLKVNKSGDYLNYILGIKNINNNTIYFNNSNTVGGGNKIAFNDNFSYFANSAGVRKFSNDYNFDYIFQDSNDTLPQTLVAFQTFSNSSTGFPFFQGRRARGSVNVSNSSAIIEPVQDSDVLFRIVGTGWDGEAWGGSSGAIDFVANGTWSTTAHATKLDFYTRDDTGGFVKRVTIMKNGSVSLSKFSSPGGGTDYVCVDENGMLFRQSAVC